MAFLNSATSSLSWSAVSSLSSLTPACVLLGFEQFLERIVVGLGLGLHVEHDVAIHLHEAAIAVPGETLVARLLGQGFDRLDRSDRC